MSELLHRKRFPTQLTPRHLREAVEVRRILDPDSAAAMFEALRDLWGSRGTLVPSWRHQPDFVGVVLEVAGNDEDSNKAQAFAKMFLSRPAAFSNTPTGLSALMFETWLASKNPALFKRFVETVLDRDTYLILFEGPLDEREVAILRMQTETFISKLSLRVACGTRSPENMISDLTVFEAEPQRALKPAKAPAPDPIARSGMMPGDSVSTSASLVPQTESAYARVVAEGGISTAAVPVVFGRAALASATVCEEGLQMVDPNGVPWIRSTGSDHWVPRLTERPDGSNPVDLPLWRKALAKAKAQGREGHAAIRWAEQWYANAGGLWEDDYRRPGGAPPGFRTTPPAARGQSCGTCAYFDGNANGKPGGHCDNFDRDVQDRNYCDAWDGNVGGGPDEGADPQPTIEIDLSEHLPFESRDGIVRSLCGSWAVLEAEVDGVDTTVVVAEDMAWIVPQSFSEVSEMVEGITGAYDPDLLWAADRCVEHALAELAREGGSVVENVRECVAMAARDAARLNERDVRITAHCARLVEADAPPKEKPKKVPRGANAPVPNLPPQEPAQTDRSDDPEFYRDDLQLYYDIQVLAGVDQKVAVRKVKQKFDVKELTVLPTGEVRSPGVVDRPPPPPPPLAAQADLPPAPLEQPDGVPDTGSVAPPGAGSAPPPPAEGQEAHTGVPALAEVAPLVKKWAAKAGKSPDEAERLWKKAGDLVTARYDADPESDQWYQLKVGIFRRMMGVAAEAARPEPATIADAFQRWVMLDDVDVDEFDHWLADAHPKFLPHLSSWTPVDLHESSRSRKVSLARLTDEHAERFDKWRRLVNMTNSELRAMSRRMAEATTSISVGGMRAFSLGRRATRRILSMRSKPAESWTDEDWNWAGRQVRTISRLRAMPGELMDEGKPTEKLILLRAWGHEPRVRAVVSETEVMTGQRADWRCPSCKALIVSEDVGYRLDEEVWSHSCGVALKIPEADETARRRVNRVVIDSTPGSLPCYVGESEDAAPSFKDLKAGQVKLTDDERKEVMRKKAVWRFGHQKGKASPAVWKSIVDGKTHYVTNTHRAFAVASTIRHAVSKFHSYIRGTA